MLRCLHSQYDIVFLFTNGCVIELPIMHFFYKLKDVDSNTKVQSNTNCHPERMSKKMKGYSKWKHGIIEIYTTSTHLHPSSQQQNQALPALQNNVRVSSHPSQYYL